ncbi:unnamed protein product [Ambrosiozyma monospora]|uniref:Kinase n=1 Tax=Ambrosiozyma monospora TaxID=43982 RepID=A0A9W6YPY7_AMBMO|nr:unnamed protein product [Ambrosiozyma monospora]
MSFVPLDHKAAGHDGTLQSADGSLFSKPTLQREIDFYNSVQTLAQQQPEDAQLGSSLIDWMPGYYGILTPGITNEVKQKVPAGQQIDGELTKKAEETVQKTGKEKQYVVLENVLHGFKKPSILDVKLGSVLYDETANEEKVERMKKVSAETTSGSLSFRICGMKISDDFNGKLPDDLGDLKISEVAKAEGGYITFDKFYGRRLTKETAKEGLEAFFKHNNLPPKVQTIIIDNFIKRLQLIYNCILDTEVRIIASSLLFVYENDLSRWEKLNYEEPLIHERLITEDGEDDDEVEIKIDDAPLSTLKFIDFAHAKHVPGKGYDEELAKGVENLLSIFESF